VLAGDLAVLGILLAALLGLSIQLGWWQGLSVQPPWAGTTVGGVPAGSVLALLALIVALGGHFAIRGVAARSLLGWVREQAAALKLRGDVAAAFLKSTRPWRSLFRTEPVGWGRGTRRALGEVVEDTDTYVQTLNDRFTNPSGDESAAAPPADSRAPAGPS
jgi:hypothetical protein